MYIDFLYFFFLFFFCIMNVRSHLQIFLNNKMRMLVSVALALSVSVVLGQRPARIGPDGKPLLNRPVLEECQKRE